MPASRRAGKLKTRGYFVYFLGICMESALACAAFHSNSQCTLRTKRVQAEKFIKNRQMTLFIPEKEI